MKKGSKVITKSCTVAYPTAGHAQFKLNGVLINRGETAVVLQCDNTNNRFLVQFAIGQAWKYGSELRVSE